MPKRPFSQEKPDTNPDSSWGNIDSRFTKNDLTYIPRDYLLDQPIEVRSVTASTLILTINTGTKPPESQVDYSQSDDTTIFRAVSLALDRYQLRTSPKDEVIEILRKEMTRYKSHMVFNIYSQLRREEVPPEELLEWDTENKKIIDQLNRAAVASPQKSNLESDGKISYLAEAIRIFQFKYGVDTEPQLLDVRDPEDLKPLISLVCDGYMRDSDLNPTTVQDTLMTGSQRSRHREALLVVSL